MKKKSAFLIAIIGTIGVLATIVGLGLENPTTPIASALGGFRYFTVLSNVFVAVYFWLLYILNWDRFPIFNKMLGAIVVYITITSLVYITMLEPIYDPRGLSGFGSILCHYATPWLTIGFVIYFRDEYSFQKKDILKWVIFPLVYFVFLVILGLTTGDYIYPFFDINVAGIWSFIIAFFGIMFLFVILSYLFILITKPVKKN